MWGSAVFLSDVAENVVYKTLFKMFSAVLSTYLNEIQARAKHKPLQNFGRGGRSRTCECRNQNPVP